MNIFTRLYRSVFGTPKPKEIWRTDKEELLRKEGVTSFCGVPTFDHYDIYAIYQTSVTTGNTRVFEKWRSA